jgi:hypothetical protein
MNYPYGKVGGHMAGDTFVPGHHLGLDRRLRTQSAPGNGHDRRDR